MQLCPVIVSKNRPKWLGWQLDRLIPQLEGKDRIIVVLDGQDEQAYPLPSGVAKQFKNGRATLLSLKHSIGPDRAHMLANSHVPADAVVVEIDDHDKADKELLAELRKAFKNPDIIGAFCDVYVIDPEAKVKTIRHKQSASFLESGMLAYGMKAYRKWAYDAVGGYPTDHFPANDYALMVKLEQLFGQRAFAYIDKPLVAVVEDARGISRMNKDKQLEEMDAIKAEGRAGFRLPYKFVAVPGAPSGRTLEARGIKAGQRGIAVERSKRKPTVCFVAESIATARGGGVLSMRALMKAAAQAGYAVSVICSSAHKVGEEDKKWLDVHYVDAEGFQLFGTGTMVSVEKALKKLRPDIVVGTSACGPSVVDCAHDAGAPVALMVQFWRILVRHMDEKTMDALNRKRIPKDIFDPVRSAKVRRADVMLANSPFTAGVLEVATGRKSDGIVRPPVYPKDFVPEGAPPVHEREFIMCPSSQIGKGGDIFLALARRNPDKRFLMLAGDSDDFGSTGMRERAEALDNVAVREDWVTDMRAVYAQTRCVFLGTQTCESFSRTVAEGLACGIPLLLSDAGNLRNAPEGHAVIAKRKASVSTWDAALKDALALRPEPTTEWCIDDTPVFVQTLDDARRLSEVLVSTPNAPGITTAAHQLAACHGTTTVEGIPGPGECARFALTVISGAWDAEWDRACCVPVAYWWHSHLAQMDTTRRELSNLLELFSGIKGRAGRWICFTAQADAELWAARLPKQVYWLPPTMQMPERPRTAKKLKGRHVYLPGPFVQRKNVFTALGAVANADAEAHVTERSLGRCPQLEPLASALGVRLHVHSCPSAGDVLALAGACGAAVMLSAAETFCYAAAEAVVAGTPVVYWPGIPALAGGPEELCVADPTSVGVVGGALKAVLASSSAEQTAEQQFKALAGLARRQNAAARLALQAMLQECNHGG